MTMGKKLIKDEAATPKDSTSGKDEMTSKWIFPPWLGGLS